MAKKMINPLIGRCALVFLLCACALVATPVLADAAEQPTHASASAESVAASRPQQLPKPPASSVPSRAELVKLIDRMAAQYGLESSLVHAIVRAESNYNPHAVSRVGAVGLMQVMPATAADYGVTSIEKLFDPTINARTGTRHLKRLLGKYSIGKAVMAYNAGEGALERSNGFVTYPETQVYTHRVLTSYLRGKGVEPYSPEAQKLTGITLTPAMARARAGPARSDILAVNRQLNRLKLRLEPTWVTSPLSKNALDPRLHQVGPKSKPMFVLEPPTAQNRP